MWFARTGGETIRRKSAAQGDEGRSLECAAVWGRRTRFPGEIARVRLRSRRRGGLRSADRPNAPAESGISGLLILKQISTLPVSHPSGGVRV